VSVAVIVAAVTATAGFLFATRPSYDDIATLQSYNITEDPRRIVVRANVWVSDQVQVVTTEDSEKVTVTVRTRLQKDVFTSGEIRPVQVELREPLGSRRVVDGSSQRVLTGGGLYTPAPSGSP